MGAARRLCVRAVVLAVMMSALLSLAMPSCQFPKYGIGNGGGSSAGAAEAGMTDLPAGAAGTAGDDTSGNGGEGASGGDDAGAGGGPVGPPCAAQSCVAGPPAGWVGPVAFWEGMAPSMPTDCPQGYGNPIDLHRDLSAPNPCACTCGAQDQACTTPLRVLGDQTCSSSIPCATVSVESTCKAVSGCIDSQGSIEADATTISGGSCQPKLAPIAPATWLYHARVCQPSGGSCDDPSQVCAPTPTLPYGTQPCVTRRLSEGQALPTCPGEYPIRSKALYATFADSRMCYPCGCSSVTGGSCSGQLMMTSGTDCTATSTGTVTYTLPGGACQSFNLGNANNVHPTHVIGQYVVNAGSCSVTSPASGDGAAVPNGRPTVVCCKE